MKKKHLLIALLPSILLFSCSNNNNKDLFVSPNEGSEKHIQAIDSIKINEIINPGYIRKLNNLLLIESINTDSVFYVYSFPEIEYLYSFGKRGNGPNDFSKIIIGKNNNNDVISVLDKHKKQISLIQVNNKEAKQINSFPILLPNSIVINDFSELSNNKYAFRTSGMKSSSLLIYDIKTANVIDTLDNKLELREAMKDNFHPSFENFFIDVYKNKFVQVFDKVNRINIGHIEDNKFILNKIIGDRKTPDLYPMNSENNIKNIVYGDGLVYATNNYIFIGFYGVKWEELITPGIKRPKPLIKIYNWSGKFITSLFLDRYASDLIFDEQNSKLYIQDAEKDFDYIYVYNLDI